MGVGSPCVLKHCSRYLSPIHYLVCCHLFLSLWLQRLSLWSRALSPNLLEVALPTSGNNSGTHAPKPHDIFGSGVSRHRRRKRQPSERTTQQHHHSSLALSISSFATNTGPPCLATPPHIRSACLGQQHAFLVADTDVDYLLDLSVSSSERAHRLRGREEKGEC